MAPKVAMNEHPELETYRAQFPLIQNKKQFLLRTPAQLGKFLNLKLAPGNKQDCLNHALEFFIHALRSPGPLFSAYPA